MVNYNSSFPSFIKYMGSKSNILDFVMEGINDAHIEGSAIVDLFSGSATLSGALRGHASVIANDIQEYSKVLSTAYLTNYDWYTNLNMIEDIINTASSKYEHLVKALNLEAFIGIYNREFDLVDFKITEKSQQEVYKREGWVDEYHLFTKYYSGTYWSLEQCIWIDAFRYSADFYEKLGMKSAILAALMFAMSYNAQSTGHYAQYRNAKDEKSMNDILIYRRKSIVPYVKRKLEELRDSMVHENAFTHRAYSIDYRELLKKIPERSTIYADPPYCFVHYSRFYHAIETLVRYDYPDIKHKGRYREDRHQSPFSIRTKVPKAFEELFRLTKLKKSNLVLSYSNTGMIQLEEIIKLAQKNMKGYSVEITTIDYKHSTMGRRDDKSRNVREALIIAKKRER